MEWKPDSKHLAFALSGAPAEVQVWDAVSGKQTQASKLTNEIAPKFMAWNKGAMRLALSFPKSNSDEPKITVLGGRDFTMKIQTLRAGKESLSPVAWSADGKSIASGDNKGHIYIWRGGSIAPEYSFRAERESIFRGYFRGYFQGFLADISWSPDGTRILANGKIWQLYRRPTNWAFLYGDRQHVPSSKDHREGEPRWFPREVDAILPMIENAEAKIIEFREGRK